MIPSFAPEIIAAMREHALQAFPLESVGFAYADRYVPVENIAKDPEKQFEVDPVVFLQHRQALAFVHSHPLADAFSRRYKPGFSPHCPSGADMESQIATAMTFGIVVTDGVTAAEPFFWGDFTLDLPLLGRPFRHGVEDCYTAIRRWFWQERKIKLAEFARDSDWWEKGDDLYMENFASQGFKVLGSSPDLQPGDCGFYSLGRQDRGSTLNHAFVWLGDGSVYHHLPGRVSCIDGLGARAREVNCWVRYSR